MTKRAAPHAAGSKLTTHVPAIDGVRAIAVLLVFCFHYGGGSSSHLLLLRAFGAFCGAGWIGVPLFFVLSGFLITGILWDTRGHAHRWRNFYARRSLRIVPLYLFALLLNVVWAVGLHRARVTVEHIWIYLLYLQDIPPFQNASSIVAPPLPLFHFWSLAVEEQFYLFWPFLLLTVKTTRNAQRLCLAGVGVSLIFRLVSLHLGGTTMWGSFLLSHAGALCFGGWLAMYYRRQPLAHLRRWVLALILTVLGTGAFFGWRGSSSTNDAWIYVAGFLLLSVLFVSLIAVAIESPAARAAFSVGWLRWIGRISYGIYVYHVMFILQFGRWTVALFPNASAPVQVAIQFIMGLIGTLLIAATSYRWIEQPFLRLKGKFGREVPVPVPAATDPLSL